MSSKIDAYGIQVMAFLSTLGTWLMVTMEFLGTSPILPAIVGILAVVGSLERMKRDRAERKLLEKRLSHYKTGENV